MSGLIPTYMNNLEGRTDTSSKSKQYSNRAIAIQTLPSPTLQPVQTRRPGKYVSQID